MTDERPDSLAAQAASWVPPWERAAREPDRAYQAAAAESDLSDDIEEPAALLDGPDDDSELDEANLSDDDDDFDETFERPNPSEYGEEEPSPELGALPGESGGPATVDAPRELPGEQAPEPTDVPGGSELPLPAAVEDASEESADPGAAVDGPNPATGDDAAEVFDLAAGDDVADDLDVPITEVIPDEDAAEIAAQQAAEIAAREAGQAADPDLEQAAEPDLQSGDRVGVEAVAGSGVEQTAALGDDATMIGGIGAVDADETAGSGDGAATLTADGLAGLDGAAAKAGGSGAGGGDIAETAAGAVSETASGAASGAGGRARRARPSSGIPAQGRGGTGTATSGGEPSSRTEEIDSEVSAMDDSELRAALEAILLVVDEPVAEMQLAQIMEQPTERVAGLLEDISARYTAAGHGFDLRRAAGGWRLYTRPEYAPYVERFVLDGQSVRLTQAALETLAVVAYKQPVTRSRISAIRGVNCDGVMRTLVTRGLIEECGTESETGAFLYRTTPLFLEKLGLNSVDQLPPLAPFLPDDVEEVLDASG